MRTQVSCKSLFPLSICIDNPIFLFQRSKPSKHKIGRLTSSVIFSVALPAVCVQNEENWRIGMQFLHDETKERLEVCLNDSPL